MYGNCQSIQELPVSHVDLLARPPTRLPPTYEWALPRLPDNVQTNGPIVENKTHQPVAWARTQRKTNLPCPEFVAANFLPSSQTSHTPSGRNGVGQIHAHRPYYAQQREPQFSASPRWIAAIPHRPRAPPLRMLFHLQRYEHDIACIPQLVIENRARMTPKQRRTARWIQGQLTTLRPCPMMILRLSR